MNEILWTSGLATKLSWVAVLWFVFSNFSIGEGMVAAEKPDFRKRQGEGDPDYEPEEKPFIETWVAPKDPLYAPIKKDKQLPLIEG